MKRIDNNSSPKNVSHKHVSFMISALLMKKYFLNFIFQLQFNQIFIAHTLYTLKFIYSKCTFENYVLTFSMFINITVMHSVCSKIIRPKFLFKYIFFKLFQVNATSIHFKVMLSFFGGWKCHFGLNLLTTTIKYLY